MFRLLTAAVAAVLSVSGMVAMSAPAIAGAHPGENGKIVYTQNGDIYTVDPDGSHTKEIVSTAGLGAVYVAASPNGRWLAFDRVNAGLPAYKGLYVVNIQGSKVVNVLANYSKLMTYVTMPTWSPSGNQLAFIGSTTKTNSSELYTVNANGTGLKAVTNCDCMGGVVPQWAPSGSEIGYIGQDGSIDAINATTGQWHTILGWQEAGGPQSLSWSPDGSQIAYSTLSAIYRVSAAGNGTPTQMTGLNSAVSGYFVSPAWSPDGRFIATESDALAPNQDVYAISATAGDANGVVQVTHSPGDTYNPDWAPACSSSCTDNPFPAPKSSTTTKKHHPSNKLLLGVYDCISYNGGAVNYFESLKLASRHRYQQAFSRKGSKLVKPKAGHYSKRGKILTFHGALDNAKAKITPEHNKPPALAMLFHGNWGGITCYHVAHP